MSSSPNGGGLDRAAKPASSMSADIPQAGHDVPGFHLEPRVAKAFLRLSGSFWTGPTAKRAWLLTIGLAASLVASTYITVQMNHWNRWFFDALEKKDIVAVKSAILVFFGIIAIMAAIGVAIVITRETLQVRWREWLVKQLLATWLGEQRFYHLNVTGREPPNPEYRISDDTRWATEMLVDLGIGLVSAVIGGLAFIAILWSVGGSLAIGGFIVPGYMVWLALAYGIVASALMAYVGKPLVGRVGTKNEAEGYFRFAMMRLRENAESVAVLGGGAREKQSLIHLYDSIVARWLRIVKSHGHVTWITNASGPMIPIIPLVFAAPKYLAGDLTLGQVTQLAAAFIQVQIAISWVVDNYNRIAEWYASARRVMDIVDAAADVPVLTRADVLTSATDAALRIDALEVHDRDGHALLTVEALTVRPGETVHIAGPSGSGKSTLARVLGGLIKPAAGSIAAPSGAAILVTPQKGYIMLGTLAENLDYPGGTRGSLSYEAALSAAGLGHLAPRIHEPARWDQLLSAGERQRLGVARIMAHAPAIVVLDDAVSALDEVSQANLLSVVRGELPDAIIISVSQRDAPPTLHARRYALKTSRSGARLVPVDSAKPIAEPAHT